MLTEAVADYLHSRRQQHLDTLCELLRIPNWETNIAIAFAIGIGIERASWESVHSIVIAIPIAIATRTRTGFGLKSEHFQPFARNS